MTHLFIVISGIFVASATQLVLKHAANKRKHDSMTGLLFYWPVLLAYAIYTGVLLVNIYVASKGFPVNNIALLNALGYVFVPALSFFFLKESISSKMLVAIGLILLGVVISQLDNNKSTAGLEIFQIRSER